MCFEMKINENAGVFLLCGSENIKTLNYWRTWDGKTVYTITDWDLDFFQNHWNLSGSLCLGNDYLDVLEF